MKKIYIISGAGISAPSGIQTYRGSGKDALWNNYKIEDICTISTFYKNYNMVHEFYDTLRVSIADKKPNAAHLFVAELQEKYGTNRVFNITQNIDDLFEKAGCKKTLHLHGFLTEIKCHNCGAIYNIGYHKCENKCKKCSCANKLKPNVTFYGEYCPEYTLAKQFISNIKDDDIFLIIGTNGQVFQVESTIFTINTLYCVKPVYLLNNLEKSKYIYEDYFDTIFYESCIDAVPKLKKIIFELMD